MADAAREREDRPADVHVDALIELHALHASGRCLRRHFPPRAGTANSSRTRSRDRLRSSSAHGSTPHLHDRVLERVSPLRAEGERKGRKKQEVDQVIRWLTGYTPQALARQTARNADFATFFAEAPALPREVEKITCVVCGVRVEEIEDPLMRKISPEAESQQPPKTTPLPDPRPPAPALEHNEPGPLAQHSASAIRPKPRPRKPRAKCAELLKRVFERLPSRATPPQQLRSAHLRRHFADPDVDHRARRRVAGVCPPLAVTAERRAGCP